MTRHPISCRAIPLLLLCYLGGTIAAAQAGELAVIVNPESSVSSLSVDEVSALFMGKSNAFPNGKLATPANQPEGPLRSIFDEKVIRKEPAAIKAYWAKVQFTGKATAPKEVPNDADMKKFVASNPGAVGYIDKSAVDSSVKVVGTF
jgi:ABC-type phosphate transport system substrate-binding protein